MTSEVDEARGTRRRRLPVLIVVALVTVASTACVVPRWPVEAPMSSAYGIRWRGWLPDLHRGVDFAVPEGTPIRTMAPGTVRFSGTMRGYGTVVWMDHGGEVLTVYAHLSEARVQTGERVEGRQVIGLSGSTGNVTGPHLHFEVWRWGRPVDPVPLLGGPPSN